MKNWMKRACALMIIGIALVLTGMTFISHTQFVVCYSCYAVCSIITTTTIEGKHE